MFGFAPGGLKLGGEENLFMGPTVVPSLDNLAAVAGITIPVSELLDDVGP